MQTVRWRHDGTAALLVALLLAGFGQRARSQNSGSYAASLVGEGLRLKFEATGGSSFSDVGTDITNLFLLDSHGQGTYEIGFDAVPATIKMEQAGLGLKAGDTANIREIASVMLFNVGTFSTYSFLGSQNGNNLGVKLYDWSQPTPLLITNSTWNSITHTDPGKTKPFAIGYEDNANGLFSNNQDPEGAAPHARYGDFLFSGWSPQVTGSSTYIAMDVQLTNGATGRIYLDGQVGGGGVVPENGRIALPILLGLGLFGVVKVRKAQFARND